MLAGAYLCPARGLQSESLKLSPVSEPKGGGGHGRTHRGRAGRARGADAQSCATSTSSLRLSGTPRDEASTTRRSSAPTSRRRSAFYQDLLGFPLVELVENRDYPGSSHFFFDLGNQTLLGFFDFPGLGLDPGVESIGSVQHIAISSPRERWEQVRERLDEAGVEYAGPDRGIEESMYFKDPDGIQIELLSDPLMYFGGRQLDE